MIPPFEKDSSVVTCKNVVQEEAVWLLWRECLETGEDLRAFTVGNICKKILLHELLVGFFKEVDAGLIYKAECAIGFDPADDSGPLSTMEL